MPVLTKAELETKRATIRHDHDRIIMLDILDTLDALLDGNAITATAVEVNRICDASVRDVDVTASTLTVTEADHEGKVITLNRAAGIAVTLPAATGSGARYHFIVGTTVTSNSTTIKVAGASDTMSGLALIHKDAGDDVNGFATAASTDTVTFNGTTTGGIKGASVELIDMIENEWWVRVTSDATGTEATPFSATVS